MKKKHPRVEDQIVILVENLIDEVSQASLVFGPMRDHYIENAKTVAKELLVHCEKMVEGRQSYVEPVVRQVLQQKLPNAVVLKSFGEFTQVMDQVIAESLRQYNIYSLPTEDSKNNSIKETALNTDTEKLVSSDAEAVENISAKEGTALGMVANNKKSKQITSKTIMSSDIEKILEKILHELLPGTRFIMEKMIQEKTIMVYFYTKKAYTKIIIPFTDVHSKSRISRHIAKGQRVDHQDFRKIMP